MRFNLKGFILGVGGPLLLMSGVTAAAQPQACQHPQAAELKQALMEQAEALKGLGDPDRRHQATLNVLVNQLLAACPQAPIQDRLPLLAGPWQQVWGPYTYRGSDRGVDPRLDPNNIYQVVFQQGFYYNVSPDRDRLGRPKDRTILLRGEYKLDPKRPNVINVRFTNLRAVPGIQRTPYAYTQLPILFETGRIKDTTLLPPFFVRLFFGGGSLQEVYTDQDLRITYGSDKNNLKDNYLYILKRVTP
jgi:hypothetical protein